MKTFLILLLPALALNAGTLLTTPVASPDSQSLDSSAPGLGRIVYAIPGSTWAVDFNDNAYNRSCCVNGDFDFNDAMLQLVFSPGFVIIDYLVADSADTNRVSIDQATWLSPGQSASFAITTDGQALPVSMKDLSTGWIFFSGPASENLDGAVHAWVDETVAPPPPPPTSTPEPATIALLGLGLLCFGLTQYMRASHGR